MRTEQSEGTRLYRLVLQFCTFWALMGGLVLLAVVGINVVSIVGSATTGQAVPGDFELTEMGVAVAAFAFLPYCQIAGLNVTADIFTARAGPVLLSVFALLGALIALGFSVLMTWSMWRGMEDQRTYDYTTAILQIPSWWGFAAATVSLGLLVVASYASLTHSWRTFGQG